MNLFFIQSFVRLKKLKIFVDLIVISTLHPDPLQEANRLFKESIPQHLYLDSSIPRLYLLMHDVGLSSHVQPEALFSQFIKKSSLCYLLKYNSLKPNDPPAQIHDIWSSHSKTVEFLRKLHSDSNHNSTHSTMTHQPPSQQKSALQSSNSPLTETGFPALSEASLVSSPADYDSKMNSLPSFAQRLSRADLNAIEACVKDFILHHVSETMIQSVKDWERDVLFPFFIHSNRLLANAKAFRLAY
jgi:hypothetical protein